MEKEVKVIFVIKTIDEISNVTEYLFLDKQDYFVDSVLEGELERKSFSNAINWFLKKQPSDSKSEFKFVVS